MSVNGCRKLLSSLGLRIDKSVALNIDNQAPIHLSQNPEFHKRTKHVAVKHHRVRQAKRTSEQDCVCLLCPD